MLLVGIVLALGIPLAATLASTITVNAQQLSSSSPSSSIARTSALPENVKSDMCDPGNPSLKVVNTTEARVCGIPKTVKNPTTTATAVSTTSASPSASPETTRATPAPSSSALNQQQEVATAANNDNNVTSKPNSPVTAASTTRTGSFNNKSPLAPTSSTTTTSTTTIAPQAGSEIVQNPIYQQQQPPILSAVSNGTYAQNTGLASNFPLLTPGNPMYLGYHVGSGATTGDDLTGKTIKTSTDKGDSSPKLSSHDSDKGKSKSHDDNDGSGNKKPKKTSSKEHKSHRGGDRFFGGDSFF